LATVIVNKPGLAAACGFAFRRYDLLDECRVLLVHGVLHLLGYDHEIGVEEAVAMAAAERHILQSLKWKVGNPPLAHLPAWWPTGGP
jgi:hypothetical protein